MLNNNGGDRPESYPKPTETDSQIQNQPEYIDQEPNSFQKDISNVPEKPDASVRDSEDVNESAGS